MIARFSKREKRMRLLLCPDREERTGRGFFCWEKDECGIFPFWEREEELSFSVAEEGIYLCHTREEEGVRGVSLQ